MRPAHLQRAAELLRLILTSPTPADKRIDAYFRAHREMGSHDRGYVAEMVYGCLRHKRVLDHLRNALDNSDDSEDTVALYLLLYGGLSLRALQNLDSRGQVPALAEVARRLELNTLPHAVRANLPDDWWTRLTVQLGTGDAHALANALNQPASVDLRVNTLRAGRDSVQGELARAGFAAALTPYSPAGLRRDDRKPLFATEAFKNGRFEIQDEGSQLLSLLVDPQPKERVVDFCAGGGGKTLHLATLMNNGGTLYAFDVHTRRLDQLKIRLRRAGLHNVRSQVIENERDAHIKRLRGGIDRVLVDAPCSGSGTLRRNPDIKWRPLNLDARTVLQRSILAAAATLVKPGGRLVYATCSVLREENENIVEDFLSQHSEFRRVPVNEILAHHGVPLTMPGDDLRLYPHVHGTDGFYGAVLVKGVESPSVTAEI